MSAPSPLRQLPLFSALDPQELELIKSVTRTRRLEAGETLFNEGDRAPDCYVLLRGTIEVLKRVAGGEDEPVARLEPGSLIGHVALIDGQPRSAKCRSTGGPAVLLRFDRATFDRLYAANSTFAFKILDRVALDLVARLRAVTARLTQVTTAADAQKNPASEEARLAARILAEYDTSDLDLDDLDLDAVTFEIPDGTPRPGSKGWRR